MSALASGIGTGAVSPPEAETCLRTEWPLTYSEKYSRLPSVTRDRLEVPSFVICSDEVTAGGDFGDLRNRNIPTNAATATRPNTSPVAILTAGCGLTVASAAANMARILSFESGTVLTADPAVFADPDSISRRRRCKSARISAAV